MRMNLLSDHARELLDMPENWEAYEVDVVSNEVVKVSGAVAPLYSRGDKKGKKNWSKRDKATDRTTYIPISSHKKWLKDWEKKTGKCWECDGKGEVFSGWSKDTGTTYKTCPRCKGSGKAVAEEIVRL